MLNDGFVEVSWINTCTDVEFSVTMHGADPVGGFMNSPKCSILWSSALIFGLMVMETLRGGCTTSVELDVVEQCL